MTNCIIEEDFPVEIFLKLSFQNKAGNLWHQYEMFKKRISTTCKTKPNYVRDKNALPGK